MEVIPAIDIRDGRCVRLFQGDYARETVYSDDPVETARRWVEAGARRLHVVDLDGARDGVPANSDLTRAVASAAGVPVQAGGGIRSVAGARALIDGGVDRVVFGTAALDAPEEVEAAIGEFGPERVVVAVDARDGVVATRGWLEQSEIGANELFERMSGRGARRFMYTDIGRDGTLSHPNLAAIASILEGVKHPVIAAGGVATIDDLLALAGLGVEAAVTGRAIYTGAIDLAQAIRRVSETD